VSSWLISTIRWVYCLGINEATHALTQPGHPSVGGRIEYWRWLRPTSGKKRQVLRNSGPCCQECWHADSWPS